MVPEGMDVHQNAAFFNAGVVSPKINQQSKENPCTILQYYLIAKLSSESIGWEVLRGF